MYTQEFLTPDERHVALPGMKIFVTVADLDAAQKARVTAAAAGHTVVFSDAIPEARRAAAVADADVVFGNVACALLQAAPRLRWVQLDSAGVNAYVGLNAKRATSVVVTNLHDFYGRAVAEAALAGILASYRQLPRLLVAQTERRWIKPMVEPQIGQLHSADVVILGAGAIGRRLAALLVPFEGRVRLFARKSPAAQLHDLPSLDAALASADVIVNALPEVPDTIGILSERRLSLLRSSALVVNVGRGSALDESALLRALDAGRLGGAVLDVTAVEPLPADHPFWTHPRVILLQHTGGRFPAERDGKVDRFVTNFARFVRGETLVGTVDLARGY